MVFVEGGRAHKVSYEGGRRDRFVFLEKLSGSIRVSSSRVVSWQLIGLVNLSNVIKIELENISYESIEMKQVNI